MRKIKFFLAGLVPGIIIMLFIFNQKGASCSGYLPNSRVIAETNSKQFQYTEAFKRSLLEEGIDEEKFRKELFSTGEIQFDKSEAQREPCPRYLMYTHDEKYQIQFEKCDSVATFHALMRMK